MNDDFNTPNVITYLLSLVKDLNAELRNNGNQILTLTSKIIKITKVLGLLYPMPKLTDNQKKIYHKWIEARNNKDFNTADTLRKQLIDDNIL